MTATLGVDAQSQPLVRAFKGEGATDEEALEKYGQQIINEVDKRIGHAEAQVTEMKRNRNEMIRIMREDRK